MPRLLTGSTGGPDRDWLLLATWAHSHYLGTGAAEAKTRGNETTQREREAHKQMFPSFFQTNSNRM
jgi:hypothetical protein